MRKWLIGIDRTVSSLAAPERTKPLTMGAPFMKQPTSCDTAETDSVAPDVAPSDLSSTPAPAVTAIVVSAARNHNQDDHESQLAAVLQSLAEQTRPVDAVVLIARTEEARSSAVELYSSFFDVALKADGPPLASGVIDVAQGAAHQVYGDVPASKTWCWLLDDNTVVAKDALECLLQTADERPDAAVVGAKQLMPGDPPHLVDVGYTQTFGHRIIPNGDSHERDQGQRDNEREVVGVSHRGCLIRLDVAQQLDGQANGFSGLVGMMDYCLRVRRLGHSVVVSPPARVLAANRQFLGRREQTQLRMMHTPVWLIPFTALLVMLGGVARLIGRTIIKEPHRGLSDLKASWDSISDVSTVWTARKRLRRAAKEHTLDIGSEPAHRLRLNITDTVRWHRDRFRRSFWSEHVKAPTLAETLVSSRKHLPGAVVSLAVLAFAVVTWWPFLSAGQVSGGALGLAPQSAVSLWEAGWSTHRDIALGTNGPGDPALGLWSVLSWLAGDQPRWAIIAALALTPSLAAASMWLATRTFVHNTFVRLWAMLTWASLPLITMTLAAGQISTAAAVAVSPAYVWAVGRTLPAATNREALGPASLAGLIGAGITALSPPLGLAVVGGSIAVAVLKPKPRFARWWHVVVTSVLIVPFVSQALTMGGWRAVLAEVGVAQTATRRSAMEWFAGYPFTLPDWTILPQGSVPDALRYGLPMGLGWALPVVAVVAIAVTLSSRGNRARMCTVGCVLAMVGVVAGASLSHMWSSSDGSYRLSVPHTPWVGLALLGAVFMAASGLDWVATRLTITPDQSKAVRVLWRGAQVTGVVALLLVPGMILVGTASDRAVQEPQIRATSGEVLPLVARDAAVSPLRTRTLVLRPTEAGVRAAVVRANGLSLAGTNTSASSATRQTAPQEVAGRALTEAVAVVVGGKSDPRSVLTPLGVGFVTVTAGDDSQDLVDTLMGVQGLDYAAEVNGAHTWWVRSAETAQEQQQIAAATLFDGRGETRPFAAVSHNLFRDEVPAGERERLVTLAEPFDPRWQGRVDGTSLRAERVNGWAQGFWVPAEGGTVDIEWTTPVRDGLRWAQLAVLIFAALLLLPVVRSHGHSKTPVAVIPKPRSSSEGS